MRAINSLLSTSPLPPPPSFQRSLCHELHRLMRVMWSGKWAVVTPHTVLNSVWRLIPSFHGYTQQDAQEFLWWVLHNSSIVHTPSHTWPTPTCSELLDRLQTELEAHWPLGYTVSLSSTFRDIAVPHEILPSLFQGRLSSKVRRVSCVCTVKGLSQLWFIPHLTYRFWLGFLIPLPPSLLLHFLR